MNVGLILHMYNAAVNTVESDVLCERFLYVESDEGDYVEVWFGNGVVLQLFGDGIWQDNTRLSWNEVLAMLSQKYPDRGVRA